MMELRLLLFSCLITSTVQLFDGRTCLTGYMTDVQTWVDEHGNLTPNVEPTVAIDLSLKFNAARMLRENLEHYISMENTVKYLSLAKCNLSRIPKIFHFQSLKGDFLSDTIEYLTLYGNIFTDISSTGQQYVMFINATDVTEMALPSLKRFSREEGRNIWYTGFDDVTFKGLKELDLRACSIETIDDLAFKNMPNLEALYLGENNIHTIRNNAFNHLTNLVHLDMSRNSLLQNSDPKLLGIEEHAFRHLDNLRSIDMSFTMFHPKANKLFSNLGPKVERLSICYSGLYQLSEGYFNNTSMRYLDLSGNFGVLDDPNVFRGIENTLQVLYASDIRVKNFEVFDNMQTLVILKLSDNEITTIRREVASKLRNLQVLDLDNNRYATWSHQTFHTMRSLRLLSLRENSINVISTEMLNDIKDVNYVGLSGNLIVCSCCTRRLIEMAAINEFKQRSVRISLSYDETDDEDPLNFNTALTEFNTRIEKRLNISYICGLNNTCRTNNMTSDTGRILLFDYEAHLYSCLQAAEGKLIPFIKVAGCDKKYGLYDLEDSLNRSTNLLLLLLIPGILLPIMLLLFMFRRRVRYFLVTMRNSATLSSIISNDGVMDDTKIYNYDVFVSYCHEDRGWMLDQLLPHLETECSVSVCLHERDFQVGLSILENIVSCIDRSRTIMLIISKQFLKSQWCQFEMHLAQHRLLETRREDLTLVLLEDIPRRLRPNTLHYLMLTKTYIVWPQEKSEQALFWKRLKKSLVTRKNKLHDNDTLA